MYVVRYANKRHTSRFAGYRFVVQTIYLVAAHPGYKAIIHIMMICNAMTVSMSIEFDG